MPVILEDFLQMTIRHVVSCCVIGSNPKERRWNKNPRCIMILIIILLFLPRPFKDHFCFPFLLSREPDDYGRLDLTQTQQPSKVEHLGSILKRCVARLRNHPHQEVDLVFLVDSSASVGAENFYNEIKFIKKVSGLLGVLVV